jgi:hypothetical protein
MIKKLLKLIGIAELKGEYAFLKLMFKPWLIFSKKEDAIILISDGLVIWEDGEWLKGTWRGDLFLDGCFNNGKWTRGIFRGRKFSKSIFKGGCFNKGKFTKSVFKGGRYYTHEAVWFNSKWVKGYRDDIFTKKDPLKAIIDECIDNNKKWENEVKNGNENNCG